MKYIIHDVKDFERITVSTTVKTLSADKIQPSGKRARVGATIFSEGGQWRFRVDGGNPTADVGNLVDPGMVLELDSINDLRNFKAIRAGTTDAVLHVNYLGGE